MQGKKQSAGILLYRQVTELEVLLVHPGGPFWKNKDDGAWSIPKGEIDEAEDSLQAAIRELKEETGWELSGDFLSLGAVKQKAGKTVYAWALESNVNVEDCTSNTFEMEWPPKSGKIQLFPEIDKAGWFNVAIAKQKLIPAQFSFIDELEKLLKERS